VIGPRGNGHHLDINPVLSGSEAHHNRRAFGRTTLLNNCATV
jgi:hypothetical protein